MDEDTIRNNELFNIAIVYGLNINKVVSDFEKLNNVMFSPLNAVIELENYYKDKYAYGDTEIK